MSGGNYLVIQSKITKAINIDLLYLQFQNTSQKKNINDSLMWCRLGFYLTTTFRYFDILLKRIVPQGIICKMKKKKKLNNFYLAMVKLSWHHRDHLFVTYIFLKIQWKMSRDFLLFEFSCIIKDHSDKIKYKLPIKKNKLCIG